MAETTPQRRVPLGPLPEWTEEDLEAMSVITPGDIEHAQGSVQQLNPTLANLLNAPERSE